MILSVLTILAHNPGGTTWIPFPLLISLPIPFLVAAFILIAKRRNRLALFAILAAMAVGMLAFALFVNSIT